MFGFPIKTSSSCFLDKSISAFLLLCNLYIYEKLLYLLVSAAITENYRLGDVFKRGFISRNLRARTSKEGTCSLCVPFPVTENKRTKGSSNRDEEGESAFESNHSSNK